MATLEKIRKMKALLAIVIGGALLAFIIEVGFEALSRSGGNRAAAIVGNEKIDIMEFSQRVQEASVDDQQNNQQTDPAVRQQEVLDEMISEVLLEQEYKKLGLAVSDWEITQMMTGKNPVQPVIQFAQQLGAQSPAELYDFITNPTKHGVQEAQVKELRVQWEKMKNDLIKNYKLTKLTQLLGGCLQPNDLDRAQMAQESSITNVVTFAKKDYASIPDDKYPVSDADLKAQWEKMKPLFKIDEELRAIHYIAVNIEPSQEDIVAANKIADAAYIALQKGRGVDSVRLLGTVHIDTALTAKELMPAKVRDFFASAEVGSTRRDSVVNNHHVMYKLINKQVCLDSVNLSYVLIQGDAKVQKEALDMLNAGKTIDDVKKAYPQKVESKSNSWERMYGIPDSMKVKINNATIGTYFKYSWGPQAATLLVINEKKAPKTFYTLATVSYDAYASTKTSEMLRDKFQDYLNKYKTAKAFEENAAKAGFNAESSVITPSTPQLGGYRGIKDSRKAIKWAFENKKGEVSPIFSDNNDVLVAVAVDEIYDEEYLPYTFQDAQAILTQRIRNDKKGDDLMKQYQGKAKDLNGYAALMTSKIDTARVVFDGSIDPKLGNEPGLVGRIAAAKPGTVQGPYKGENAVIVYQVVKQEKDERTLSKEELDARYAQTRGSNRIVSPQTIYQILTKATKVKKNLIDFY